MRKIGYFLLVLSFLGCSHQPISSLPDLMFPQEKHFEGIRQLTHGGTNAEAYWSFDGDWLTFQHQGPSLLGEDPKCDQIYKITSDGANVQRISDGKGRTTCSFFLPSQKRILFSSTRAIQPSCPPQPDRSHGYVWPIYNTYQIYGALLDGGDILPLEPTAPKAYNAEATVCHDGSVIFTSDREGDLDLYRATLDSFGTFQNVRKITQTVGYDGGAVFSADCKKIAWRASRPRPGKELLAYQDDLKNHLVKPTELEIWTADADGSHARQVTRLGVASFAPTFTPDGQKILFSANLHDPNGHQFDLYLIHTNGTWLEQVTFSEKFDSFPMFSPDGKHLAFSSNRNNKSPHETNIFVADWIEKASPPLTLNDPDPANRFLALVQELSSPSMEGRGVDTLGLGKAEELVAEQFQKLGLKPFSDNGYLMPVDIQLPGGSLVQPHNVVGTWGNGCKKVAPIVVGAHLDHLGKGSRESLDPNQTGLHPGADDNASGVAALVEVARILSKSPKTLSSCFIFTAFTGEEAGIAGSSQFAKILKALNIHPKAMLNMDMVGRMENNHLMTFGSDSAREWTSILNQECTSRRLECNGGGDGYGPSDHMAFYLEKTPVLHFFTGPHLDYHRKTDTFDKINATGGIQVSEVVAAVALRASLTSQKLHFQKASESPTMGAIFGKQKKSKGAYLGTIPDYASLTSPHGPAGGGAPQGGVKLAGTRPGSPADKAGIQPGDVLKSIQEKEIKTLQDFTDVLADLTPGDQITVKIEREGKPIQLAAKVGKRD
jgi:Tol biopolymer transport system component